MSFHQGGPCRARRNKLPLFRSPMVGALHLLVLAEHCKTSCSCFGHSLLLPSLTLDRRCTLLMLHTGDQPQSASAQLMPTDRPGYICYTLSSYGAHESGHDDEKAGQISTVLVYESSHDPLRCLKTDRPADSRPYSNRVEKTATSKGHCPTLGIQRRPRTLERSATAARSQARRSRKNLLKDESGNLVPWTQEKKSRSRIFCQVH